MLWIGIDVCPGPLMTFRGILLNRRITPGHNRRHTATLPGHRLPGRPEVNQHRTAVIPYDYIAWLDIPVQKVRIMHRFQGRYSLIATALSR